MKKIIYCLFILFSFLSFAADEPVRVFAASSLTDVLTKVAATYEQQYKVKILLNFDSSSRLARQISEGLSADIFFSADKEWNTSLEQKKLASETKDLISNELVLIAPLKSKLGLTKLESLSAIKFKNICIAQESVPVGRYAYESLKKAAVLDSISKRVVNGDNVRNVLAWVAKDETDLGIVFVTDALVEKNVKVLFKIPADYHSKIIYPISLMRNSLEAKKFFSYLQSDEVKSQYKLAGFKNLQ